MFDTAVDYDNILRHSRALGYKLQTNPSAFGAVSVFVMVPGLASGIGPDLSYAPLLRRGSEVSSTSGNVFTLLEDLDFSDQGNTVTVVGRVDDATGVPTYYAIKASGRIISGRMITKTFAVGAFERFRKIEIGSNRVAEIVSITDSQGNEYFEVENLSDNIIYKKVINRNDDKYDVPNIVKPVTAPRRFTVERTTSNVYIQFGHGSDDVFTDSDVLDPSNTVLDMYAKEYITDTAFDPYSLIKNDKMGIAPSNTTMTVVYRENTQESLNAATKTITRIQRPIVKFKNQGTLDQGMVNYVVSTLECTNESPIRGDVSIPTSEELKMRAKSYFSAQKRCVTISDYQTMAYNMPSDFGALKRVNIFQGRDSFKRNLNFYVVSEDQNGNLARTPETLKENLREWIRIHKMVNDSIDILDAKIVNYGIQFRIVSESSYNRYDVLQRAINTLALEMFNKSDIGESILISKIYNILNEVDGVEDTVDVKIIPKNGGLYSNTRFNFVNNITPDGRMVKGYQNVIFELKYPSTDIQGTII
jgi:hypothetical protein